MQVPTGTTPTSSASWRAWITPSSICVSRPMCRMVSTWGRGSGLGSPAACLNAKQVNYDGSRAADGAFTFTVTAEGNTYGLEWGVQATPGIRTDTQATDGDSLDGGAASAFGLQAYLLVTDFDGDDGARRRDTDPSAHDGSYGRPGDDGGRSASRGRARRRRDASIVRARWAARRIADRLHPPAGWPSGVGEAGMVTAYVAWTIGVLWWVSSLL